MSNPNDDEYEIEYSFSGPTAFDVLSSEVRELRQFYQDEKRCRCAFEREIENKMKLMLEKAEKEIEDKMKIKLENLQFEQRSVENDLRAQIGEQQSEIIRLKKIAEEKSDKIVELMEKIDINLEPVQVQPEDVKHEQVQNNQAGDNNRDKQLSQNEIVALFENCMITPESNRFHTHADVAPFLRALDAGIDNLKFRINYLSPFNKEKGWNIDQHFLKSKTKKGYPGFMPKTIYKHDGHRIIIGNYGLDTYITDEKSKKGILFSLLTPLKTKLKIAANVESDCDFETPNQRRTREDTYKGKRYNQFWTWIEFPEHHAFLNGASISITWTVSHEK